MLSIVPLIPLICRKIWRKWLSRIILTLSKVTIINFIRAIKEVKRFYIKLWEPSQHLKKKKTDNQKFSDQYPNEFKPQLHRKIYLKKPKFFNSVYLIERHSLNWIKNWISKIFKNKQQKRHDSHKASCPNKATNLYRLTNRLKG